MRLFIAITLSLLFVVVALSYAEPPSEVTLAWDANSEPDLAGYRIFERSYVDTYDYTTPSWEGTETTCTLSVSGHRAFVARAFDEEGNESENSNEASTWDGKPQPPGSLTCTTQ